MIGTGHPITYCNGLTSVDGSVKVGQRFTKKQCDEALAKALPKYWDKIEACIPPNLSGETAGSLLDASFNAGPAAVCRSPMVALMNAGKMVRGCNAFEGWYVRSDGAVRNGLIARRDGEDHGDFRLSEKGLCLRGLSAPKAGDVIAEAVAHAIAANASNNESVAEVAETTEPILAPRVPTKHTPLPKPKPKETCQWWRACK